MSIMARQVLRNIIICQFQFKICMIMIDETTDASKGWTGVDCHLVGRRWFVCSRGVHRVLSHWLNASPLISSNYKGFPIVFKLEVRTLLIWMRWLGKCDEWRKKWSCNNHLIGRTSSSIHPLLWTFLKPCSGRCSKPMKSALETINEIAKLIKISPKSDAMFQWLKQEIAQDCPRFRILCPTIWNIYMNVRLL